MGAEVLLFGATYPLALLGSAVGRARSALPERRAWVRVLALDRAWHARPASTRDLPGGARARALFGVHRAHGADRRASIRARLRALPGRRRQRFRPDLETADIRAALGVGDRPLVVCVSRLVARKGQDMLIRAMPAIRRRVPDAALAIVGGGPYEDRLRSMAADLPTDAVSFAGQVAEEDLPRYYAAGDVFAMPCRTRLAGLEVEGWGNVFIEAAACGRPVVVGDSGGARESLVDGQTGAPRGRHERDRGGRGRRRPAGRARSCPGDGSGGAGTRPRGPYLAPDRGAARRLVARGRRRDGAPVRQGRFVPPAMGGGYPAEREPRRTPMPPLRRPGQRGCGLVRPVLHRPASAASAAARR